jgi:histidine triad (HIT) family protein
MTDKEKDCVFCKIVSGELPCHKILEDKYFLAFLDVNPAGEGHTVVIPKKHIDTFLNLDNETSGNYVGFLQKTGRTLKEKYNADDFNLVLNNGKSAGQVVWHVHFHILPRKKDDGKKGLYVG